MFNKTTNLMGKEDQVNFLVSTDLCQNTLFYINHRYVRQPIADKMMYGLIGANIFMADTNMSSIINLNKTILDIIHAVDYRKIPIKIFCYEDIEEDIQEGLLSFVEVVVCGSLHQEMDIFGVQFEKYDVKGCYNVTIKHAALTDKFIWSMDTE